MFEDRVSITAPSSLVRTFLQSPDQTYDLLRSRLDGWIKKNPHLSVDVVDIPMPEYRSELRGMLWELKQWRKTAGPQWVRYVIDPLVTEIEDIELRSIPYAPFVAVAQKFAIAMEFKIDGGSSAFGELARKPIDNRIWQRFENTRYLRPYSELVNGAEGSGGEETPLILFRLDDYTLHDELLLSFFNLAPYQGATLEKFFDGGVGGPYRFLRHDGGHANQRLRAFRHHWKRMHPESNVSEGYRVARRGRLRILNALDSIKDPLLNEALDLLLFEILYERYIPAIPVLLREFLQSQLTDQRFGKAAYYTILRGATLSGHSDPRKNFVDLIVSDKIVEGFYGADVKERLGGVSPEYWFKALEMLFEMVSSSASGEE